MTTLTTLAIWALVFAISWVWLPAGLVASAVAVIATDLVSRRGSR